MNNFQNIKNQLEEKAPYINIEKIQKDSQELLEFKTNKEELASFTLKKEWLDAFEERFEKYEFDKEKARYLFNYETLKYWDILPSPPVKTIQEPLNQYSSHYSQKPHLEHHLLSKEYNLELNKLTNTDVSFQNTSELILNGDFYTEKLKMIQRAHKFILASNMFLTGDYSQESLFQALEDKIKKGVKVYFILDKVFALKYSKAFKRLESIGVEVFYLKNGFKIKNRTIYHSKFWIFDNQEALVYGANILDAQIHSDGFNNGYRDTGVKLKGPCVRDLTDLFIQISNNFDKKSKAKLSSIRIENDKIIAIEKQNKTRGIENFPQKGMMRIVFQGAETDQGNLTKLYQSLIAQAKSHIFMTNVRMTSKLDAQNDKSVFDVMNQLLGKAKNEKVRVDILTNNYLTAEKVESVNYTESGFFSYLYKKFVKREDMRIIASSMREHFLKLKVHNFKIWHYFQFSHSKVLSVDNVAHVIGSYNLNKLSTDNSYEVGVLIYNQSHEEISKMIVRDLINSAPLLKGREKAQ